jgi:hypothetical protein
MTLMMQESLLFCKFSQVEQQFVRKEESSHASSKQWQEIFQVVGTGSFWNADSLCGSTDCVARDR